MITYLHGMYGGHFVCNLHRKALVGQLLGRQRPGFDVLLDASAGEHPVQLRSEPALRQQGEDDTLGDEHLQASLAVRLAVDADQHLFRILLAIVVRRLVRDGVVDSDGGGAGVRKADVIEEVR